jgi:gas vesicle protein
MSTRTYYSDEARRRANMEKSVLAVLLLGLGMSIGAVLALLFAPEKGEILREELAEQTKHLQESVKKMAG